LNQRLTRLDVTAAQQLIDRVVEHFGRIDILINNASIDQMGKVDDSSRNTEAFERFWAVKRSLICTPDNKV
jgi:NAD(P)-dependent dehydrogenase (short-subunit alcohol dehydrogenase family)